MREQAEDGAAQGGTHLDDKLHLVVGGVTGRDEGGVQGAAEGGQGVHGLLVVESEDGVHPAGELGANCKDSRGQEDVSFFRQCSAVKKPSQMCASSLWAATDQPERLTRR